MLICSANIHANLTQLRSIHIPMQGHNAQEHDSATLEIQDTVIDDQEVVYVLDTTTSAVKYVMTNPQLARCACTCAVSSQGQTCVHQVAWLLLEYPSGHEAEQLVYQMLGNRLGAAGGCNMNEISILTDALSALELKQIEGQH